MPLPEPATVRALTESLVRRDSISPGPAGENACADLLARALPDSLETGRVWTEDQRAVLWSYLPGSSDAVTLLLGHHDTVGVEEFGVLGAPSGARIAFDPTALRDMLLSHAARHGAADPVLADLEEERAQPGTWMFGRGALDMKSGLAAGVAAMRALAEGPVPQSGVLFASCPDEESDSAGMRALVQALPGWLAGHGRQLTGVLNLDFSEGPWGYRGAMGKLRAMLWVRGTPTHVGAPFAGVDAAVVAAALARALPLAPALVDRVADGEAQRHGPHAAVLRLRDLKERYDVQTATEAVLELNLQTLARGPDAALLAVRDAAREALAALAADVRASGASASAWSAPPAVLTYGDVAGLAGSPDAPSRPGDPTALAIAELRALAQRAGLGGPCVVVALLPPFYPHAPVGASAFTQRVRQALEPEGVELRGAYPFITDASLVAGDARLAIAAARWMPGAVRDSAPPIPSGVDMVDLGPWGRDAHGLYERVRADWAFAALPRLLECVLRGV